MVGPSFQFCPIPDAAYTGTLAYWTKLTPLSDAASSNWVLATHPDVYLYGTLVQSAPYLMDDARLSVWGGLFTTALEDMLNSEPIPIEGATLRVDEGIPRAGSRAFSINAGV